MKLYPEIKTEYAKVLEAKDNAKAWSAEAKTRMKPVDILIAAARKLNPDMKIDRATLIKQMENELRPTEPAADDPENTAPDDTEVGEPEPEMEFNPDESAN